MAARRPITQPTQSPDAFRLQQIQQRWAEFPGSLPNGTGKTGIRQGSPFTGNNRARMRQWSDMQNDNTWALNALRAQNNQGPMQVRGTYAGTDLVTPSATQLFYDNPSGFQQSSKAVDRFFANNPYEQAVVASLRGLRGAR